MGNKWDDDENALLTRLWKREDVTSQMLTTVFVGRTAGAISEQAFRLGVHKEHATAIDYDALKAIEI